MAALGLPDGFRRTRWLDVRDGDEVYTWAQTNRRPLACGPFVVESVIRRKLRNPRRHARFGGVTFPEPYECLLLPASREGERAL
jgi:hypothetical protein